jgi:biotin operon repressor
MSNQSTQSFRLFSLLKAGNVVGKETIAKELEIALMSVPVYIHELKKNFKADIQSVREGRNVVGYKLLNKNLKIPEFRKNSATYQPKPEKAVKVKKGIVSENGELPTLDPNTEITQITEREFADISDSLGIGGIGHSWD